MTVPEAETRTELVVADAAEPAHRELPQWPVTRLPAAALTLLLALALLLPVLVITRSGPSLVVLLVPVVLATALARVMFESLLPGRRRAARAHLLPALSGAVPAAAVLALAAVVVGIPFSWGASLGTAALASAVLVGAGTARDIEIRWRMAMRRVYFVGGTAARTDLARELSRRSDSGFVGGTAVTLSRRLTDAVIASQATVLVVDREAMAAPEVVEAAAALAEHGVHVRDLVSYYEAEFKKVPLAELTPTWFLFDVADASPRDPRRTLWRISERFVAATLLLLALPFLLIAAILIRLTSPGPALFRQTRVGRGGTHFTLRKLRTMRIEEAAASDAGAAWAGSQAHRITPVGRFLRRFRLDELPQLWNVVCGELALVGPRPEQVPIAERFEQEIPFYAARHSVRPGLTGWAQVNLGYAGSLEGTMAKLQRDLYYVKHAGWRLDCLIVWLTLKAIFAGPDD
jgi:lipopolysaccharide/colanic/teichoic acid biosynthesis glycosyltransferase